MGQDPFSQLGGSQPPLEARKFREMVTEQYAGDDVRECIEAAVEDVWPAPGFREHQQEAIVDILANLYVADKDVVLLSAPTGAGKSLILYAAMAVVAKVANRNSFFTTPLNALIDQVDNDEFIADDVITIKGKNNYNCVHRQDRGTPVDKAVCQRVSDFECEHKKQDPNMGGCPYYGRKYKALAHPEVVTNMSYLMANSMIPETVDSKFDPRELLVVDECQNIEDFALQFVGFTVSKRTIPSLVFDQVDDPPRTEDVDDLADWLESGVLTHVERELARLDRLPELTEEQADDQERLQEFSRKANNFVRDVRENHWVAEREVDGDSFKVEFNPIFIGRFLDRYLWSQASKVVLSSATIPRGGFLEEIGLDDRSVGEVEIPSTFPTERRPVVTDETVGKMTMGQRDTTIPKMATKISELADEYEGYRGFVHCHSYRIAERIYQHLDYDVRLRTRVQDSDDREASLDDWLEAAVDEEGHDDEEGGQVFLSVAMDEGISLDDWRARWQVVAKVAYPFVGAKRVSYRMDELDDWTWYNSSAITNLQQAVGRGMRSADDMCITYILDSSVDQLLEYNEWQFEDWWLDSLDVEPCDEIKQLRS